MIDTVGPGVTLRRITLDPALIAILAAALAARWTVATMFSGPLLAGTWEYEEVALNLLNGNGFVGTYAGTAYRALVHPVYPAFCAFVYWIVGHPSLLAIQVVQSAAVIPAGVVAFDLASTLAGRRAGLLAAAGMTLHPSLMLFSLRRHALWFDAVIFLVALWAALRLGRQPRLSHNIALGALFGIGLLSRATIAVFMLAACAWLAWQWRTTLTERLLHVGAIAGTAAVIATPWLIRNAVVLQKPVGFISTTPYGLWIGNNPAATTGALAANGTAMDFTAPALVEIAQKKGVEMPIAQAVAAILSDRINVEEAISGLLSRPLKAEI